MANKLTFFPAGQAIAMRKKDVVLPTWRNFYHFEEACLLQALRAGMLKYPYKQKVQYTDVQTCYMFTNAYFTGMASAVHMAIVDKNGNIIEEHNPDVDPENFLISTYTYKSGDIEEETDVLAFRWRYTSGDYPEGEYYIYWKVTYGDGTFDEFLSEPQWVKANHKNTARIDYTHNEDDFDILFVTMGIYFTKRIDSNWMKLVPKGEGTHYTEQDEELRQIYGRYYRCFELNIKRAPEYEIDKLGRIFTEMRNTAIEGTRMLRDAETDIEFTKNNNSAVGFGKITVREYYNDRAGLFISNTIRIFTRPGTYPYMMPGFHVTDGIKHGIQGPIEIVDATFETDWVTNDLNLDMVVNDMDATGSYSWDGDDLIYTNAPGEGFYLLTIIQPMDKYFEITMGNVATAANVQFYFKQVNAGFSGYWVIDDTVKKYKPMSTTGGATLTNLFASTGTKTMRVYNTAILEEFIFGNQPTGQTGKITNITGSVANTVLLKVFRMFVQNITNGTFDPFALLSNARSSLTDLFIGNSGLTNLPTAGIAANASWPNLKAVVLKDNGLSSAEVDDFLIAFEAYSGYTYGGSIYIRQNPAAAPTATSLNARNALIAKGWIINWTL